MNKEPVLIIGAASDIGMATARAFAAQGHPVQLALRDSARAEADRADIALRHSVEASLHEFDVTRLEDHARLPGGLNPLPGIAVCVVGLLGDQEENRTNPTRAQEVIDTNFTGPAAILERLGDAFAARGSGVLVGISSVAGDRGRASNYVYGSAKAGFTAYLSGLRNRLAKAGVHVVTVKPGFVQTQMTAGMNLSGPLVAEPEEVANAIVKACRKGHNVIYVRWIWRWVMTIIRLLPEFIFKRMSI